MIIADFAFDMRKQLRRVNWIIRLTICYSILVGVFAFFVPPQHTVSTWSAIIVGVLLAVLLVVNLIRRYLLRKILLDLGQRP